MTMLQNRTRSAGPAWKDTKRDRPVAEGEPTHSSLSWTEKESARPETGGHLEWTGPPCTEQVGSGGAGCSTAALGFQPPAPFFQRGPEGDGRRWGGDTPPPSAALFSFLFPGRTINSWLSLNMAPVSQPGRAAGETGWAVMLCGPGPPPWLPTHHSSHHRYPPRATALFWSPRTPRAERTPPTTTTTRSLRCRDCTGTQGFRYPAPVSTAPLWLFFF